MNLVERPITVKIRDNSTGETVSFDDVGFFDDDGFSDYIWSEGNYSCDCNRDLFFHRAKDLADPEDTSCGDNKYIARITCEGAIVYDEFDDD